MAAGAGRVAQSGSREDANDVIPTPKVPKDFEVLRLLRDGENDLELLWRVWLDTVKDAPPATTRRTLGAYQLLSQEPEAQTAWLKRLRQRATDVTAWRKAVASAPRSRDDQSTPRSPNGNWKFVQWLFPAHSKRPFLIVPLTVLHTENSEEAKQEITLALEQFRTELWVPGRVEECDLVLDCSGFSPHSVLLSELCKMLQDVLYYHPAQIHSCRALCEPKLLHIWSIMGKAMAPSTIHFEGETVLGELISKNEWQMKFLRTSEVSVPLLLDGSSDRVAQCTRNPEGGYSIILTSGCALSLTVEDMHELRRTGMLQPILERETKRGLNPTPTTNPASMVSSGGGGNAGEDLDEERRILDGHLGIYSTSFYGQDPHEPPTRQHCQRERRRRACSVAAGAHITLLPRATGLSTDQSTPRLSSFSRRRAYSQTRRRSTSGKGCPGSPFLSADARAPSFKSDGCVQTLTLRLETRHSIASSVDTTEMMPTPDRSVPDLTPLSCVSSRFQDKVEPYVDTRTTEEPSPLGPGQEDDDDDDDEESEDKEKASLFFVLNDDIPTASESSTEKDRFVSDNGGIRVCGRRVDRRHLGSTSPHRYSPSPSNMGGGSSRRLRRDAPRSMEEPPRPSSTSPQQKRHVSWQNTGQQSSQDSTLDEAQPQQRLPTQRLGTTGQQQSPSPRKEEPPMTMGSVCGRWLAWGSGCIPFNNNQGEDVPPRDEEVGGI